MSETVVIACAAMGTRFELVLCGDDPVLLRAAGEAAIEEIEHAHDRLTAFERSSVVSAINAAAGREPVRVDSEVLALFELCERVRTDSRGAFDVTVGRMMESHGFVRSPGRPAAGSPGRSDLIIDRERSAVMLADASAAVDLGAVGKGFALDLAAAVLADAGVSSGLLHGGSSTAIAIGSRPDGEPWAVALPGRGGTSLPIRLRGEAFSMSASSAGTADAPMHVLDPATGDPASAVSASACVCARAAEADAWSTAMVAAGGCDRPERWAIESGGTWACSEGWTG